MFAITEALIAEQFELENQARELGIKRYQDERMPWSHREKSGRPESELPPGLILTKRMVPPMSRAVSEWVSSALDGKGGRHVTAAKFVSQFDPDLVAVLTARVVINGMAQRSRLQSVALSAANCLLCEKDYSAFREAAPGYYLGMLKLTRKMTNPAWRSIAMGRAIRKTEVERLDWSLKEKVHLGIALINLLIRSTGAVSIIKSSLGKNKTGSFIEPTPEVKAWIERAHDKCAIMSPLYMPMVVPPRDWTSPYDGGYLNPNLGWLKLVKTHNNNYLEDLSHTDMPKVYRAVNAVQSTPWRINKRVYDVMRELWDADQAVGGLPPREDYLMPAVPADMDTNEEAKAEWKRKAAAVHRANAELLSRRIEASQKLWIARKFQDHEAIWFPHVLDWRGRFYPVPARVNPQADDTGRALLEFAEGKPVGEYGGYWLAVHVANLFGVDKVSFDDRVQWVADNGEMLCAVAADPLNDQRWADADKPFQALAACFEWAGFLETGEEFVSHLPIALDG